MSKVLATINVDAYWSACDVSLVEKDADQAYKWVLDTERLSDSVDKLLTLCYESGGTYLCKEVDGTAQPGIREMFAEGRAATTTLRLLAVELDEIRNMQDQYGIVPMPKLSKEQADYKTYVQAQVSCFGISAAIADENRQSMLSAVMESIAYNSNEIIVAFRGAFQYGVAVGLVSDAFNNTAKAIKGFLSFQC